MAQRMLTAGVGNIFLGDDGFSTEVARRRVLVVGCEPASIDPGIGLSAPVEAAVDEAVRIVTGIVGAVQDAPSFKHSYGEVSACASAYQVR